LTLPAGVSDSGSSYTSFGGEIIVSKSLAAASSNNICLSQAPAANTPLILNGSTSGVLDTGRRVLVTYGSEASPRTLQLAGLTSQGQPISETIAVPAGASGSIASARDYLVVTSVVPSASFTAAVTVGTNATGSTQWQLPARYQAQFAIGCTVSVPSGTVATVECTRDIAVAVPQIYQPGQGITPPICAAFAWPTLNGITAEASGDIDSAVAGVRLTVTAGIGRATLRMAPIGLRT
jgi:hypothetical protein